MVEMYIDYFIDHSYGCKRRKTQIVYLYFFLMYDIGRKRKIVFDCAIATSIGISFMPRSWST